MIFLKSGILTTLQDLGRSGYQHTGLNNSGAMDTLSMRLLNILLGNKESEGVLEFHFPSPTIVFEEHVFFATGGAEFSVTLNDLPVDNWKIHTAKPGDMLAFSKKIAGERGYLSIKGGFKIPSLLGSQSTNILAGIGGKHIQKGDRLDVNLRNGMLYAASNKVKIAPKTININLRPPYKTHRELRIIADEGMESLAKASRDAIFSQKFIISGISNRMGYRLEGECLNLGNNTSKVSSSVAFGTIQLLPDGQLIILMADHQTTGGYPRLGKVIAVDLHLLAQLSAGEHISFREITLEVAESVLMKQERELHKLKTAVNYYL